MRRRTTRTLSIALAVILLSMVIALPVLSYTYRATLSAANTGATSYAMIGLTKSLSTSWMVTNAYMSSTGLDMLVQNSSGTNLPFMLVSHRINWARPLAAASQPNDILTVGNSPALTAFSIVPGYNSYLTTTDAAALEMGSNFEFEYPGWIDFSQANKYIASKREAFAVRTTSTDTITAGVPTKTDSYAWSSTIPAGWTDEAYAYDNNTATYAYYTFPAAVGWSPYLTLNIGATTAAWMDWYAVAPADVNNMELDVYYDSAWHNIFTGSPTSYAWVESAIYSTGYVSEKSVTSARVRFYDSVGSGTATASVAELQLGVVSFSPSVSQSGLTSGYMTIKVTGDGANLKLYINGVEEDSTAIGGGIPGNSNNWYFMTENSSPYADYIKETVSSVLVLHYEPNTYISGSILPDRAGTANDATITWGSNPSGVSITTTGLVSASQPGPVVSATGPTQDTMQDVNVSNWFEDADMTKLSTNPLRPFVLLLSDTTTLTELQAWRYLGLVFVLFITVWSAVKVKGHQIITGIASAASMGVLVAWSVWPLWTIVFVIGAIIAGAIAERTPVI